MGQIGEWAKTQSKFLSIKNGEKAEVTYTGKAVLTDGKYGEGWNFSVNTEFGPKVWSCRNTRICEQFDSYKDGDKLTIEHKPEGEKPAWSVTKQDGVPF